MILGNITLQEETGGTHSPPLPARFRAILPRDFKSSILIILRSWSSCIIIIALYHVSSQLLFSEDIDIIF